MHRQHFTHRTEADIDLTSSELRLGLPKPILDRLQKHFVLGRGAAWAAEQGFGLKSNVIVELTFETVEGGN